MDKRSETRVSSSIRFFVHVHDCPEQPAMVGESLACEAVDFSPHGLQFRTPDPLPANTQLNITIGVGEPMAMYLLRGEIRWVRVADEAHAMGIQLKSALGTDYPAWEENFDRNFGA